MIGDRRCRAEWAPGGVRAGTTKQLGAPRGRHLAAVRPGGSQMSPRCGPEGRKCHRGAARRVANVIAVRPGGSQCHPSMYRPDTSGGTDGGGGGMLEFAILGLLHRSPMHGYELRKQLAEVLGGLRSISYGSLYPALRRMHAAGLVSTDEPDRPALLPADAPPLTGRRGKVVYTITAEGKDRFHELVGQTGPEAYDDGGLFGVRLAFFRHTASDVRLRILEGRRRTVERQREGLRASLARTRERLDRYTLEL